MREKLCFDFDLALITCSTTFFLGLCSQEDGSVDYGSITTVNTLLQQCMLHVKRIVIVIFSLLQPMNLFSFFSFCAYLIAVLPFCEGICWPGPCIDMGGLGHARLPLLQQELQPEQDKNSDCHPGRREGPSPREVRTPPPPTPTLLTATASIDQTFLYLGGFCMDLSFGEEESADSLRLSRKMSPGIVNLTVI